MIGKDGNKIFPIYQLIDLIFDLNYLSGSEKLICIAFLRFYNRRTGKCFPGLTTLSECTGLTRKTLIENIKKLAQKKVIKVKKGNRHKANEYGLLFLGWLDIEPLIEPLTTPLTTPLIEPLATPQPSKVKLSEGNKDISPKPKKENTQFDKFWEMYGKKVDRKKCLSKFNKLKQSDIDSIFAKLPGYVESTPDPQYRKNPYSYLHNESWNDQIIPKGKLNGKAKNYTGKDTREPILADRMPEY